VVDSQVVDECPTQRNKANPSLGGTTRNHLKEWLKNQKHPNHFFGPFSLNVLTTINCYFLGLSIACFNIWLEVYLGILKIGKLIFFFLTKIAPKKIDSLNFENS
jgi:hypothetical protein